MSTAFDSSDTREAACQGAAEFDTLIAELDELIQRHDSAAAGSETGVPPVSATQLLQQIVDTAGRGLQQFPRNGELLRRRAYARCRMASSNAALLQEAQDDLQGALQFEPTNLRLALDLMGELFAFDGLEDREVAEVAGALAEQAEQLMLEARALQIRALLYADECGQAADLAEKWQQLFPKSEELTEAVSEFELALIP